MKANLPYSLGALRGVTAAQVKAMYDALAAVVNGGLDAGNFSPRARIGKANRAAPFSLLVLEGELTAPFSGASIYGEDDALGDGPNHLRWKLPVSAPAARIAAAKVAGWSYWIEGAAASDGAALTWPPAGGIANVTLRLRRETAGGVVTQLDSLAGMSTQGFYGARALAPEVDLAAGDSLHVVADTIAFSNGANRVARLAAAVWLKMEHLP